MTETEAAADDVARKLDPDLYAVVQPVCTSCHGADNFLHSRRWPDWERVLSRMAGGGATATPEQWVQINAYFRQNLSLLYVNYADDGELSTVLGVDEKTAVAIVQRRADRKFDSAADMESVAGVNTAVVEALKPRLQFGAPTVLDPNC
jgi:hypothetical protein